MQLAETGEPQHKVCPTIPVLIQDYGLLVGVLEVNIIKATNMKGDIFSKADIYVKVYLQSKSRE